MHVKRYGILLLALVLASCASGPTPKVISDQKTGFPSELQFVVGEVSSTVDSPDLAEIDSVSLMSDALKDALRKSGIQWQDDPARDHATLNLKIVNYEPGNAFGRWLMPGVGATVLAVEGTVTDVRDGEVLARIRDERGIYAGGAYTIGAWRTIFSTVAEDIVAGLLSRTGRNGFVVNADAWLKRDLDIPVAANRHAFVLEKVNDRRPDKGRIGERFAAFGVSMGDVYFYRPVTTYVEEMIADDLRAAGHTVAESGEGRAVSVDIDQFWITTKTTALYWDIVADIRLSIGLAPTGSVDMRETRVFSCESTGRTYAWPTQELFEKVLDTCLLRLMDNLRNDPVWQQG